MRFKRSPKMVRGTKDARGNVCITVFLRANGPRHVKGNMMRSVTVHEAKVSDVFAAINRALFGKK